MVLSSPLRGGLNEFYAVTQHELTLWGIASVCASSCLLLAYFCFPRVRRTPGWQFLYSSLCEIYVASGFIVLSLIGKSGPNAVVDVEKLVCGEYSTLLLSILGFDMAANSWRLFIYVDLIVVYHNPFRPNTARPLYHLLVALIVTLWLFTVSSSGVLCSVDASSSVNLLTLTWGLVYAPFLLFVLQVAESTR